jgi:uncharacterized protein YciW
MAEQQGQQSDDAEAQKQQLKQEFQQLLNIMFTPSLVDKEDIKKLKDAGGLAQHWLRGTPAAP